MKLTFIGATGTVTSTEYLLATQAKRMLVMATNATKTRDPGCGMMVDPHNPGHKRSFIELNQNPYAKETDHADL